MKRSGTSSPWRGSKLPEANLSFFCDLASAVLITCYNSVVTRFERIVQMTVVFIAGKTVFIYTGELVPSQGVRPLGRNCRSPWRGLNTHIVTGFTGLQASMYFKKSSGTVVVQRKALGKLKSVNGPSVPNAEGV